MQKEKQSYIIETKRLTKNTLILYVRQIVTLLINFFATRELLLLLGVVDFGLVNVVGGVVTMFSFLGGMLSTASSRFFNFELGKSDFHSLRITFNTSLQIYLMLIAIIFVGAQTFGIYFLNNCLEIPVDRVEAANKFFQFTIFTFIFNVGVLPFMALVISHENIKFYSILNIFETLGKLIIIYITRLTGFDYFVFYGCLLLCVAILNFTVYFYFCLKNYPETKLLLKFYPAKFKELLMFSLWNVWGATAMLFGNVFIGFVVNNFFGAAVNSARAIAIQVSTAMSVFSDNLLTASKPQIVKNWAKDDKPRSFDIVCKTSKIGFVLILMISIPVFLKAEFLLSIWLEDVPKYTVMFLRFAILQVLIGILSHPLITLIQATGKIALYQTVVGLTYWVTLPLAYVAVLITDAPVSVMITCVVVEAVAFLLRIWFVRSSANLSICFFFKTVILPCCIVFVVAPILPWSIFLFDSYFGNILSILLIGITTVISVMLFSYCFVANAQERLFINEFVLRYIKTIRA